MQETHNSIADALELCLSCTNPSIYGKGISIVMLSWCRVSITTSHHLFRKWLGAYNDDKAIGRHMMLQGLDGLSSLGMSHEHHGTSNHWWLNCLSKSLFRLASYKTLTLQFNSPFVRGIHQWLVDSPHKRPVKQKRFNIMTSCGLQFDPLCFQHICHSKQSFSNWEVEICHSLGLKLLWVEFLKIT